MSWLHSWQIFKIQLNKYACSCKCTVKPVLSGHSKRTPKLVFNTNYYLMQVKSIAECSKGSILQYFQPSLSYHFPLGHLFCLFISGRLILSGLFPVMYVFFCFCCFMSHVNSYGHCGTVSSLNHTFSWAGLSKRLTSNLCTYFRL